MKNANPVFGSSCLLRYRRPVALLLATASFTLAGVLGLTACNREKAALMLTAAATNPKGAAEFFPIKVGDKVVRMQLAVRPAEMQRGLMERRDLGRDDGMIFVYDKPQKMSFWMHNTPTALDIGFFNAEGVLEEVYPMYPFDETSISSHSSALQFALEMNQGWFKENGVKPGARIDRKALGDALRERGFAARKFGFPEAK